MTVSTGEDRNDEDGKPPANPEPVVPEPDPVHANLALDGTEQDLDARQRPLPRDIEVLRDLYLPAPDVSLDATALQAPVRLDWKDKKIHDGGLLALILVSVFGGFVVLVMVAGILVAAISRDPSDLERYASAMSLVLEASGNFATAVFAPLLAFVLGFYFGEKSGSPQQ